MEELDLLKKAWKNDNNSYPKISEQEIYNMLHKKSSSIVKWIFIISVLEIVLWSAISFFSADENYLETLKAYHIYKIVTFVTIVNYGIIALFIFLFYKNFRQINATDNVKALMKNILQTRKTVKYYIWYNLGMIALTFTVIMIATFKYDTRFNQISEQVALADKGLFFWVVLIAITVVFMAVFLVLFWLFYRLIYGFLLKRLRENYEELKKIDL